MQRLVTRPFATISGKIFKNEYLNFVPHKIINKADLHPKYFKSYEQNNSKFGELNENENETFYNGNIFDIKIFDIENFDLNKLICRLYINDDSSIDVHEQHQEFYVMKSKLLIDNIVSCEKYFEKLSYVNKTIIIKHKPQFIELIDYPNETLQLSVIENNLKNIKYIKNPTKKVQSKVFNK
jgi:hypothetical protein